MAATVPRAWSAALALAVFAVYLAQTPPVSGDKDAAEFTLVLALDGVAHPTGYPLFTLFGHPWTVLVHALGASWAYAANSWSALGGAVAIYLMHRLALALPAPGDPPGRAARMALAALPVAFFAFDPLWTYETTLAEVYAWHVAWALGLALYLARLAPDVGVGAAWPTARLRRHAVGWGLLCGVGGAHHATSILVAAPLTLALAALLARRRRLSAALVAIVLAAAALPLTSYGILLWRASHPVGVQWPALTPGWSGLWFHATGGQYSAHLGGFTPSAEQQALLERYLWGLLAPATALLLLAAWRARGDATRATVWGLTASALLGLGFAFDYAVPDPSSYFLQPLAFALVAPGTLLPRALAAGRAARRATWTAVALLGAVALTLSGAWIGVGAARVSTFTGFDRYLTSMWRSIPFERGFVFWANDMYYKLRERQLLDHEKPGLEVEHPLFLSNRPLRLRFIARHGFDPTGDVPEALVRAFQQPHETALEDSLIHAIEERVNAATPLPVVDFDPMRSSVRLLRKPVAADSAAPPR